MRKGLLTVVTIIAIFAAACASDGDLGTEAAQAGKPLAIEGYDSVAYFAADKAARGNPQFSFVWKGAKWIFSNRENLDKFRLDPESYAPQFGSHCPVSLSRGGREKGDPSVWRVVKDKLYIFYNEDFAEEFDSDPDAVLKKAAAGEFGK